MDVTPPKQCTAVAKYFAFVVKSLVSMFPLIVAETTPHPFPDWKGLSEFKLGIIGGAGVL